ncbi:biotin--[acetyl-CoA-carboxylase] ligase [Paenibacillus sp. N3/727]|uniref:biotin--[acetyl-CoA-carboxylase] ligase n=1 Tax=Paenibacillus sp. N3/727 TaxID=2925845 RepID=UPI001F53DEE2|nr:biotin--[acetyl-CoA-carboxylase] ligase [Paenibacillus sp. N3/727]UNK20551.1 biotin--[acetyl-CoA-carboxylase] ligase [Paenibacillus sp. N3/727]
MKKNETLTLLDIFLEQSGQFLSGEEISRRLNISRTAVWKQINKLRSAGYEFEALPRLGYRMTEKPEPLDPAVLSACLTNRSFGHQIEILRSTTSTQEDARRLAEEGAPEGTLVIAEEQTGGRGRMGKKFYSPFGKGIWMSLILRPTQPLHLTQQLTLLAGVAVRRAIHKTTGLEAGIKWPNDLLIDGKKICGILLESATEDDVVRYCIAGIGISVNLKEEDYPDELKTIATSLRMVSGHNINRNELICSILNEMESLYGLYNEQGFEPIASLWEASSVTMNREVRVQSSRGVMNGTAAGLHPSGALLVRNGDGELIPVFSGDIKLLK